MTEFAIPQAARDTPARCHAQAPDEWTVECTLDHGHGGAHRNNMTVWHDQTTDNLDRATERWQAGRVLLFDDVEPDLA